MTFFCHRDALWIWEILNPDYLPYIRSFVRLASVHYLTLLLNVSTSRAVTLSLGLIGDTPYTPIRTRQKIFVPGNRTKIVTNNLALAEILLHLVHYRLCWGERKGGLGSLQQKKPNLI